jgi:asparagine N-glycosylation enzyme membrane subunit Stt3
MLKNLIAAALTWLVPFLMSFGFYNPETHSYLPNYIGFKLIMAILVSALAYLTMQWLAKKLALNNTTPLIYTGLNSLLDVLLLVGLFAMPVGFWMTTILPIYVLVFSATFFLVSANQVSH